MMVLSTLLGLTALMAMSALGAPPRNILVGVDYDEDDDVQHVESLDSLTLIANTSSFTSKWCNEYLVGLVRNTLDGYLYGLKADFYDDDEDQRVGVRRFDPFTGKRLEVDVAEDDDFIEPYDSNGGYSRKRGGCCHRSWLREATDLAFGNDHHLYVANNNCCKAKTGNGGAINRYNGLTGRFIDEFVTNKCASQGAEGEEGSALLDWVSALAFDFADGSLYVANYNTDTCGDDGANDNCDGCDEWDSNVANNVLRYDGQTGEFIEKVVFDNDNKLGNIWDIEFHNNKLYVLSACYDAWDLRVYERNAATGKWALGRVIVSDESNIVATTAESGTLVARAFQHDNENNIIIVLNEFWYKRKRATAIEGTVVVVKIDEATGAEIKSGNTLVHDDTEATSLLEVIDCREDGAECDDNNAFTSADRCQGGQCLGVFEARPCVGYPDYNLVIQVDENRQYCAKTFYTTSKDGQQVLEICDWVETPCDQCTKKRNVEQADADVTYSSKAIEYEDDAPIDYQTADELPAAAAAALSSNGGGAVLNGGRWKRICPALFDFCDFEGSFIVTRDDDGFITLTNEYDDGYQIVISPAGRLPSSVEFRFGNNAKRTVSAPNLSALGGVAVVFPAFAGLAGDPHVQGPNGERFDFDGEAGVAYELFSSPHFVVNARMAPEGPRGHYMNDVVVLYRSVKIDASNVFDAAAAAHDVEHAVAHLNAELEPLGAKATLVGNRRRLVLELCDGHRVEVARHEPSKQAIAEFGLKHLTHYYNVDVTVPGCHDEFDGIIGQLYQCKYATGAAKFVWNESSAATFARHSLIAKPDGFQPAAECYSAEAFGVHLSPSFTLRRMP